MNIDGVIRDCQTNKFDRAKIKQGKVVCTLLDLSQSRLCEYVGQGCVCVEFYSDSVLPDKVKYYPICTKYDEDTKVMKR